MSENKMIELDKYNCALKNRNLVQCITLQLCLQYNGIGVQEQIGMFLRRYTIRNTFRISFIY